MLGRQILELQCVPGGKVGGVHIPPEFDRSFRLIPIADSDGFRSLVPPEFDRRFRWVPITGSDDCDRSFLR